MLTHDKQFPIGTRVRLRDGVDPSLYNGFSRVGNEGTVVKRKFDKYKYPQVYIEFDKNHWAYNGTEDGWTWQGHWEAVEENDMADEQKNNQESLEDTVRGITESFVKALFGAMNPGGQSKLPLSDDIPDTADDSNKWEDLVTEASESIAKSPAYLLIALEYAETPNAPPMIVPRVFHGALEPEYALIVQSQLAHIVASFQDATIATVLEQRANEYRADNE
jgi:hypothetical protein